MTTFNSQAGDENKATESGGHLADDSDVPVSYSQVSHGCAHGIYKINFLLKFPFRMFSF